MKKVIRLTESQLEEIIKRVISEQENEEVTKFHKNNADRLMNGVKPAENGKYCFTKESLAQDIANTGIKNVYDKDIKQLFRIKPGQTLSHYQSMTDQKDAIITMNHLCKLKDPKGFRAGDVIVVDFLPSH
jgi:hypothetical protein